MAAQPAMRILGVFAHPDDEVFCGGGVLARYSALGAETMVVSLTRGEAGQIHDARVATRRTLGDRRAQELADSCQRLGVRHVRCLDYGDGKLATLPPELLIGQVTGLIREFRPDVVFTFDETGAYGHPDHIAVSRITTAACAQAADPARFPEQVAGGRAPHTPARLYHSYFPRNDQLLLRMLVEWLAGLDTRFRGDAACIQGIKVFADESSMLGYAADHIDVAWYPDGFFIIEQGEPASSLYLILSGEIDVIQEDEAGERRHIAHLGPGSFIGETGIAQNAPRNAHCVAAGTVTCLVFSPASPTNFAGRGDEARYLAESVETAGGAARNGAAARIDVREYVPAKLAAMAAHRSQYPLQPERFPRALLEELLGYEYFVQIMPPPAWQTDLLPARDAADGTAHTHLLTEEGRGSKV
ncbi:MAG: PIG-L family deacetylase [Thermomicrobiales bacterium]|jgi:LmbE family N-acetylglucosaminyl deacetylase|nr:PIG-L family deacetylase [Thermomicrobiales bacterium]